MTKKRHKARLKPRKRHDIVDNELTTLCYIEKDGKYLMLHRTKKQSDPNRDLWMGVGGHFEKGESPEDCVVREVREETGFELTDYKLRGVVSFSDNDWYEYMFLYSAQGFKGEMIQCNEGDLEWIDKESAVRDLPIWEGDRIFLRLMNEGRPFFSLKLRYENKILKRVVLDGKEWDEQAVRAAVS